MKLPRIPKLVWIGAAAAAVGFVVYKAVKTTGDSGGRLPDDPNAPVVGPGLKLTWDTAKRCYNLVDVEKTKLIAYVAKSSSWSFRIDGVNYVAKQGSITQTWPRTSILVRTFK